MSARDRFVACARAQVGKPYKWATAGPDTFDCSGLTSYCAKQAGFDLSRDSHAQLNAGVPVKSLMYALDGDILCFDTMRGQEVREGNACSHVGVYIERTGIVFKDWMINALNEESGVVESSLTGSYWFSRDAVLLGIRRIFTEGAHPPAPEKPDGAGVPSGESGAVPDPFTKPRDRQRKREKDRLRRRRRKA